MFQLDSYEVGGGSKVYFWTKNARGCCIAKLYVVAVKLQVHYYIN